MKITSENNCNVINGNHNVDVMVNCNPNKRMKTNYTDTSVPLDVIVHENVHNTGLSNDILASPLNLSCNKRSEESKIHSKQSETSDGLYNCKYRLKTTNFL